MYPKIVYKFLVLKKLQYMAVVKEVCSESMLGAQEEAKNRPGYHANGEVTNVDLDEIMEVFP